LLEGEEDVSAAFLKKSSKKLLNPLGYSGPTSAAPVEIKIFCGAFL